MSKKILTEIGELFGQFRKDSGEVVDFTKRVKELGGEKYDSINPKSSDFDEIPKINPFFSGPTYTNFKFDRYYGWQRNIIQTLSKGNDVYVVAPPGGGKTTPLMAYWFVNLFLRGRDGDIRSLSPDKIFSNTIDQRVIDVWSNIFYGLLTQRYLDGSDVPKVLFITPIRVLSFEQAEDFQNMFLDLIIFLKSLFLYLPNENFDNKSIPPQKQIQNLKNGDNNIKRIIGNVFEKLLSEFEIFKITSDENLQDFDSWAKQFTYNSISVKTGGGSDKFNKLPERAIVTIATYGAAKNFISKIVNTVKFIVYDEAQRCASKK